MADNPGKSKRRPVDALFGEEDAPAIPSYIVEAPQPVTTVSPPPPAPSPAPLQVEPTPKEEPKSGSAFPKVIPPSIPAFALEPAQDPTPPAKALSPRPAPVEPPAALPAKIPYTPPASIEPPTPALPAVTPTPTSRYEPLYMPALASSATPPTPAATPVNPAPSAIAKVTDKAPVPSSDPNVQIFTYLNETIRQLYEEVNNDLSDSPTVSDYCMKTLMQARDAFLKGDYAAAEYYVAAVDAKLQRSAVSAETSRSPIVFLLWIWELFMLVASGAVVIMTYIAGLTLFGLPVAPEFAILMRAVGWGGIGGVIGAFYNLPWFIQYREYDPAYNMNYFVRPLQGFLIGAVLFLLSQAGIIAGNTIIPGFVAGNSSGISIGPVFLYLLAALAGFKQEYVYEFFDGVLKTLFRLPQLPTELRAPSPIDSTKPVAKKRPDR